MKSDDDWMRGRREDGGERSKDGLHNGKVVVNGFVFFNVSVSVCV